MEKNNTSTPNSTFKQEVYDGLSANPKFLSSKYFYDAKGDKLFQDIMKMPEYYLTDSEFSILENHKEEIAALFYENKIPFYLIELGAGDGKKTKIILEYLSKKDISFDYLPIDISQNALDNLEESLKKELPELGVKTLQGTYFNALEKQKNIEQKRKVILFLGSNIGNMLHEEAIGFLKGIREYMNDEDQLLVGFDLKKNPETILDAYNDSSGITAAFNKNILHRINKELGANFNSDNFKHWETYNPETGTAKSYLVSTKEQKVTLENLELEIEFKPWETIHTEISQKYDDTTIKRLAEKSGLIVEKEFSDAKNYYKNYIFKKTKTL